MWKSGCCLSRPGTREGSTSITSTHHCTGGSRQCNRQEKEIHDTKVGQQELRLPLFADMIIIYIGNPVDLPKS